MQKMQTNNTFNLQKHNHIPRKHHRHHHQQHRQQPPPTPTPAPPTPANGQQASGQNEDLTINLNKFGKLGEKTFIQHSHLFGGNLPPDITEEEMKLFEKYGKVGEIFHSSGYGFGFIRLETRTLADIAKVELDNTPLHGKHLRARFARHSASPAVQNCPWFASNERLEEAFSVWPGAEGCSPCG